MSQSGSSRYHMGHAEDFVSQMQRKRRGRLLAGLIVAMLAATGLIAEAAHAASPCDNATLPSQCAVYSDPLTLPPFIRDAIVAKGGVFGAGDVMVLTSGDPADPDNEISNDMGQPGCGTNPDGWETYDCVLMNHYVPPQDSVVIALSAEWFEWYQTIFTDWMTVSGAGVPTVDVSINSWITNKVDIIPYGPMDTGVVLLTSLAASKMVDFRVSDSGDHIYDTAILVVPATWFSGKDVTGTDPTILCGDGKLEPGEECDDGNNIADDGCSNLCLGTQPPSSTPPPSTTCGNLVYNWPNGTTSPYTCGADLCMGFRCVAGNTISPSCYTASQCAATCSGSCVDVQAAQLDCSTMCTVQPPANEPPPPPPATCATLSYVWPDGTSAPYDCNDTCSGQRCVVGTTISPECYAAGECDAACPGSCVDVPADCGTICALGELPATCTAGEAGQTRPAANQKGRCAGNVEFCKASTLTWTLADGSWTPDDEKCNGLDDDCNGVADDMFKTCGDPGLCQNTVNTCDPANPTVPVACVPLPAPSPVEICNNGLDDDCDGAADDGCECGDDECMPGENYANCPADCPPPANFTACNDNDLCTTGEYWYNGACVGGYPVSCDDGNACVVPGACDPATGCSATKLSCDDAVACTVDSCDVTTGCLNVPDDASCNDADPCTLDTCDAALGCTHAADPACLGADADGDGHIAAADGGDDCNDDDATVYPGAVETCNGVDDDCNGTVDDGYGLGGACSSPANACGAQADGSLVCSADGLGVECSVSTPDTPPGYGNACDSPANDCGQTAAGTIGCAGACSATTPANPAGYGDACDSAANDCGQAASGTVGCDGACSASTPANPAGYGDACTSAPNTCGQTADGTVNCDGDCSASTPANPAGYGDACTSAPNACGQTADGTVNCDGDCSATTPVATDSDGDGTADCLDGCPADAAKTAPGVCGCGTPDADTNGNGIIDCQETVKADLAVTATSATKKPKAGKRLRLQVDVRNLGPALVTPGATIDIAVSGPVSDLKLPSGCTGTVDAIGCTTKDLKAGKHKSFTIGVVPAAGANVVLTATVSSPVYDPAPGNQSATLTVVVP